MKIAKAAFALSAILTLSGIPAIAGEGYGEFTGKDAADGVAGRMGDLSGTPQERGERVHNATVDSQIDRAYKGGDAAGLLAEKQYERTHQSGYDK
jgi:hypothetical protein